MPKQATKVYYQLLAFCGIAYSTVKCKDLFGSALSRTKNPHLHNLARSLQLSPPRIAAAQLQAAKLVTGRGF